jgi:catechol 2,3-dioxygenase-like lactoylglutathione lyase family enzyme
MTVQRMEHVGVVVDDLAAAIEFFVLLGLELEGEASVEDPAVDRVVGLEGVRTDVAYVRPPGGGAGLELIRFRSPAYDGETRHAQANAPGLRHLAFVVDDLDGAVAGLRARGHELVGEVETFGNAYRLCYVSGPEGIIVELAAKVG